MLAVEYHPLEKNQIVSCGKSLISFWTFEGGTLAKKNGIFDVSVIDKVTSCYYLLSQWNTKIELQGTWKHFDLKIAGFSIRISSAV